MATYGSVAAAAVSAIVPGADVVVGLLKEIRNLCQLIKKTKGTTAEYEALSNQLDLLAKQLESDKAKLEDSSAIAAMIGNHIGTVSKFKKCLVDWIDYAEKHRLKMLWEHNAIPDEIVKFDNEINKWHKELGYTHIIEDEKWKQTDSKWKEQLTKQVTEEHSETRELVVEGNNKIQDHETKLHIEAQKRMDAKLESLRKSTQLEEKDISKLIQILMDASDDMRLEAAKELSKLAKTQEHLTDILEKGGVKPLMELAREGFSTDQIEQIEATMGAIYYFSEAKVSLVGEQIVQPLLLVLLHKNTTPGAKKMAAGVLNKLSSKQSGRKEIADHSGISALVNTIRDCDSDPVDQQRKTYAVEALKNLSRHEVYHLEVAETIPTVIKMLRSLEAVRRDSALAILEYLLKSFRAEIVAANGIPALLKLLRNSEAAQRDSALVILKNLSKNYRAEIVAAGGIPALKKLLPDGYNTEKGETEAEQYAVSTLELLDSLVEDPLSKDSSDASSYSSLSRVDKLLVDYRENLKKYPLKENPSKKKAADLSYQDYHRRKRFANRPRLVILEIELEK